MESIIVKTGLLIWSWIHLDDNGDDDDDDEVGDDDIDEDDQRLPCPNPLNKILLQTHPEDRLPHPSWSWAWSSWWSWFSWWGSSLSKCWSQ